jgi:hypothetical protein
MSVAATSRQIVTRQSIFAQPSIPSSKAMIRRKGWGWCYVNEVMFDLSDRPTPHLAPIPIDRIEAIDNIEVLTRTEIVALYGSGENNRSASAGATM